MQSLLPLCSIFTPEPDELLTLVEICCFIFQNTLNGSNKFTLSNKFIFLCVSGKVLHPTCSSQDADRARLSDLTLLDIFHSYYPQLRKTSTSHVLMDHTHTHRVQRTSFENRHLCRRSRTNRGLWLRAGVLKLEPVARALTALC